MLGDHRRVLATGLARLRAKISYRPVVFELMPEQFTLRQLQDCVEALAGQQVHTQNFRRVIEQQELVEETDQLAETGGRPARLYRFRRQVLAERSIAGTKLPTTRAASARPRRGAQPSRPRRGGRRGARRRAATGPGGAFWMTSPMVSTGSTTASPQPAG
jgi:hypothetical protein